MTTLYYGIDGTTLNIGGTSTTNCDISFIDTNITDYYNRPWNNDATTITIVNFINYLAPTTTAYWFYNFTQLTTLNNINNLNTLNVTDMTHMFYSCSNSSFNPDVSNWDVSNVTNMRYMFGYCYGDSFNPDVSNWNVSNVTDMGRMFYYCYKDSFNPDVSNWNVSSVTDMSSMFYYCHGNSFNPNVSNWNVSNVTDMSSMFTNCYGSSFNPNVSSWDTSNVTDMANMFSRCSGSSFNPNVSNWDTSNVTDMATMFSWCSGSSFNPNLLDWDVSNVTDMGSMFYNCTSLTSLYLIKWHIAPTCSLSEMFSNCTQLTVLNIANFNLSSSNYFPFMFLQCSNLTTIYCNYDWSQASHTSVFNDCTRLVGGNGTIYNSSNKGSAYAKVDESGSPGYFTKWILTADKVKFKNISTEYTWTTFDFSTPSTLQLNFPLKPSDITDIRIFFTDGAFSTHEWNCISPQLNGNQNYSNWFGGTNKNEYVLYWTYNDGAEGNNWIIQLEKNANNPTSTPTKIEFYCGGEPIDAGYISILDMLYPIGSIILWNNNSTFPTEVYGGVWTKLTAYNDFLAITNNNNEFVGSNISSVSWTPTGKSNDITITAGMCNIASGTTMYIIPTYSSAHSYTHSHTFPNSAKIAKSVTMGSTLAVTLNFGSAGGQNYYALPVYNKNLYTHAHQALHGGWMSTWINYHSHTFPTISAASATAAHNHTFTGTTKTFDLTPRGYGFQIWRRDA